MEDTEPDHHLSGCIPFSYGVFILLIDRLVAELDRRFSLYDIVNQQFVFYNNLFSLSPEELRSSTTKLKNKQCRDLEINLIDELLQIKALIQNETHGKNANQDNKTLLISHTAYNKCIQWEVILKTSFGEKQAAICHGPWVSLSSYYNVSWKQHSPQTGFYRAYKGLLSKKHMVEKLMKVGHFFLYIGTN